MTVINMQVGAATPSGAVFAVKVDTGPARVAVADNPGMSGPVMFGPVAVDGDGVAKVSAAGLDSGTRYWWQVEDDGVLDATVTGTFRTLPPAGSLASFTFGGATCAGGSPETPGVGDVLADNRLSNHAVFELLRQRAVADDWAFWWHGGDRDYYDLGSGNHGIGGGASLANYRRAVDDALAQPNQAGLYRSVPIVYTYDDHDYGPNNSDRTHAGRDNRVEVYREREPHYPLGDPAIDAGIWHHFTIGRVLFIAADVRADRDPNSDPAGPSKTMLGADQKVWMESTLAASEARLFVWLMPDQWTRVGGADNWSSFAHERDQLVEMFGDLGWLDRMMVIQGDAHSMGFSSGRHPFGKMPIYQVAPLDSAPSFTTTERWDVGLRGDARGQYGSFTVADNGSQIVVTGTGYTMGEAQFTYQFGTPIETTAALRRTLSGSHDAVFEARVVDGFATGPDPAGTEIPIRSGAVSYDGTAKVLASLDLNTAGTDDAGRSLFPRNAAALLAPFGAEVFVRRGIDLGSHIEWFPLGIFRLNTDEQDEPAFGPIELTGQDRMSGIVDARLMRPRVYPQGTTVGEVVDDLVLEVYPNLIISFDDDSDEAGIGRQLVVERDRYEALRDLADALGKRVYFDGDGRLRFDAYPEPDEITLEISAGQDGVLVQARRRVTRNGIFNAVVATGEAGDVETPVMGIAMDNNPNSPTYFHGANNAGRVFGKVPRFYSSPILTTTAQCRTAARTILRRSLGAPYSVDFGSIVHPGLRPFDHVRIRQNDGNRERHVVDKLRVPLTADRAMTGGTREQTLLEVSVT